MPLLLDYLHPPSQPKMGASWRQQICTASGNSHFSADLPTPFWAFELDDKQPAMLARPALPTNQLIPHFEYVEYHVYILVCYLNFYKILSSLSVEIQQSLKLSCESKYLAWLAGFCRSFRACTSWHQLVQAPGSKL
jgi:hypothetical protein